MSNVVYLSDYLTRDCTPVAGAEAFADDLKLMARHIRANAGYTSMPLRFGALADEIEAMAGHVPL